MYTRFSLFSVERERVVHAVCGVRRHADASSRFRHPTGNHIQHKSYCHRSKPMFLSPWFAARRNSTSLSAISGMSLQKGHVHVSGNDTTAASATFRQIVVVRLPPAQHSAKLLCKWKTATNASMRSNTGWCHWTFAGRARLQVPPRSLWYGLYAVSFETRAANPNTAQPLCRGEATQR
jgi:hypothetical protein